MDEGLRPGTVLGGYVIDGELARGGMGIVYRARDEALGRPVALKVIAPRFARDASFRERFRRECQMAARIEHPNAVPVYRGGQDRGRLYLAMRMVGGRSLADVLHEEGLLDPEAAVAIAEQLAGALDAAHAVGLVHRDVKPGNVLLDGERAFLTDFGIAKDTRGDAPLTGAGERLGTVTYAAPEQLRGEAVDARTDVYALGGVLHHCLTGTPPYPVATEIDAVGAHLFEPPPRPSAAGLPPAFDDVIARAMAKDVAGRFTSAGELAAAARLALAGTRPDAAAGPIPWVDRPGLPAQPSALVGRRAELRELGVLLREHRLVTLTGPGGVGKTRLALQVAAEAGEAVFVPLAAVGDPALVPGAIAQAAGVAEDALAASLADRELLLVLDNLEQLAGSAPLVTELLATAPTVRVLATSRVRLDLREEQEYPLAPLEPDDGAELFTLAARRARPAFAPDGAVEELVRRLDGLPLALELAASRVRVLTVAQIVERLGRGLDLLASTAGDAPARQRTLRAAIEWSHALLGPEEQALLARLSVFPAGFDLEAAEAVCSADLDALQALVDHSLVRAGGDGRFFLLVTIRAFAAERLDDDAAVRRRHLAHFAARVQGGMPAGESGEAWVAMVRRDLAGFRLALETAAATDPDALARLVADLHMAWYLTGQYRELGGWIEQALADARGDDPVRVELLDAAGILHHTTRDADAAAHAFREEAELAARLGDEVTAGKAIARLGAALIVGGRTEEAEAVMGAALVQATDLGVRARLMANLVAAALIREEFAAALELAEEAAAAYRSLGEEDVMAQALTNAGFAAVHAGEPARATARLVEALDVFARFDWKEGAGYALVGTAAVASLEGDTRRAVRLLGAAEARLRESGAELEPFEQEMADGVLAAARAALPAVELERLRAEGAALTDEAARGLAGRPAPDQETLAG